MRAQKEIGRRTFKTIADILAWYEKEFAAGLATVKALPAEKLRQASELL